MKQRNGQRELPIRYARDWGRPTAVEGGRMVRWKERGFGTRGTGVNSLLSH